MRNPRFKIFTAFALLLLGALANSFNLQAQTMQIDSATANWIEGFADFTHWPEASQANHLTIGVINASDVATYLIRRAESRSSKPSLKIVKLDAEDSFAHLDIVFIGPGTRDKWRQIFEKCHGEGILCIGSQEGFNRSGGSVELVVRKNRLRFYIDTSNAQKCDVRLSSKLLELALIPKS